jgi:hypothetical protein
MAVDFSIVTFAIPCGADILVRAALTVSRLKPICTDWVLCRIRAAGTFRGQECPRYIAGCAILGALAEGGIPQTCASCNFSSN